MSKVAQSPSRHRLLFAVVAMIIPTLYGCGGDTVIPVYPVTGKVLYQGSPPEGALVIFYPAGHPEVKGESFPPRPSGVVQADGSFSLTTLNPKDGARAGKYKVTVVWFKGSTSEEGGVGAGSNKARSGNGDALEGKYASPDLSGLTAEVTTGKNELTPYDLK